MLPHLMMKMIFHFNGAVRESFHIYQGLASLYERRRSMKTLLTNVGRIWIEADPNQKRRKT